VDPAQQALLHHRAHGLELPAEAHLEADAGLHLRLAHGVAHRLGVVPGERDRLLEQDVFARARGGDGLLGVEPGRAADVDDVDRVVREHPVVILVGGQGQAVRPLDVGGLETATGAHRGHPRPLDVLERLDVRARRPTQPDDADVHVAHRKPPSPRMIGA